MRQFEGQAVVITGSATGIGEATALRFAAEGARVACLDVNEADNDATAAAARAEGVEAMALACDVRSRSDQHRLRRLRMNAAAVSHQVVGGCV